MQKYYFKVYSELFLTDRMNKNISKGKYLPGKIKVYVYLKDFLEVFLTLCIFSARIFKV